MKIAINTRFLLRNRMEGFGRFTFEIAKQLVLQHPEDEFFFLFDRPYDKEYIFAKNITPVVLFPPARHPILWYLWFEWAVALALKKYQIDIFFSPDGYLSLRSKVKTLMVCHDISFIRVPDKIPFLVEKYYKYYTPKFLNRADRLISLSNHSRLDIGKYYNIPLDKIDLTHAASHGNFKPITPTKKSQIKKKYSNGYDYFLYVGAIHARKNVHRLIQAFELFKEKTGSTMKLLLVGKFMFKPGKILTIYKQSPYKTDIIFTGYLDKELYAVTAAAFAATYISLYEGFGMPLVEAMECHVPIITSNVSSMPEVVGNAGLTVSPTDIDAISDAMIHLFTDQILYFELQEKCKIRKRKYTWEQAAILIYESMQKILASN